MFKSRRSKVSWFVVIAALVGGAIYHTKIKQLLNKVPVVKEIVKE